MTTGHPAPTGGLTPHIRIRDQRAREAIEFYTAAFGAEVLETMPAEDGRLMHAHLLVNGASLMLADDFPEYRDAGSPAEAPPAGTTLHLQVDDADTWFDRAVAAGATVTIPLQDMFWGDRYGNLGDPFGHTWAIGAPIAR